ncbi:septal ring lytic transglycosylase RlpA family protein [Neisseria elongata subsp. nitroreducens]|uniref:Endolytic peptidoglycan transglycosylase RlpA n=1 Tax=Neisseria elongata subsp. nitroreducens TaxID=90367 RepID=A0A9X0ZRC7_NEIEL|nr:septal ring lytic transglycosylase RlpA family protein [Neisseria elongata subsp. nitroreducens]MBS9339698.1 septal ring lytic transglycosylase RlpA family protein [Neisseria elongata subsp. nitroreducens]
MIQTKPNLFVGLVAAFSLSAWASPAADTSVQAAATAQPDVVVQTEPLHKTANLSYKVAGKRYQPTQTIESFSQTGKASWYGPGFHGKKTSSGERFDMNTLSAAHRTLPIPSYARVTNLSNGKSVVVRINDRGPFHGNRVMDVSKAAAKELGFIHTGTANVKVEQILPNGKGQKQQNRRDGIVTSVKPKTQTEI